MPFMGTVRLFAQQICMRLVQNCIVFVPCIRHSIDMTEPEAGAARIHEEVKLWNEKTFRKN